MLLALAWPASARPQDRWAHKPVQIVVPFTPGGTTDLLARELAPPLQQALGQPVVIANHPGAGGIVGAAEVAQAAPDGHTLLMGTVSTHAINPSLYARLPYDAQRQFEPIVLVASVPNVLVMNPATAHAAGIASVAQLVRHARAHPGLLNMASAGNGTSIHLSGELFKRLTRTFMVHIPYRGSAPALADLVGGTMDLMFDNLPSSLPHVRSGRLLGLAVTSGERSPVLPELPTVAEAGEPLPGHPLRHYEATSWFGLFAPAATPQGIVEQLQRVVAQALATPVLQQRLQALGAVPGGLVGAEFAAFVQAELRKWAEVVKASGARVD